jgi:DNA-binding transcriptional ArsR family regulator
MTRSAEAVLRALADPTRLAIIKKLLTPSTCNQGACKSIRQGFELSQPTLSHHFGILEEAGIVQETKKGTEKFYTVNTDFLASLGIAIETVIAH